MIRSFFTCLVFCMTLECHCYNSVYLFAVYLFASCEVAEYTGWSSFTLYLSTSDLSYLESGKKLTLNLPVSSADNFCKLFGARSGPTTCRAWSDSKLFNALMVVLKEFEEKDDLEKKSQMTNTCMAIYTACNLELIPLTVNCKVNLRLIVGDWT